MSPDEVLAKWDQDEIQWTTLRDLPEALREAIRQREDARAALEHLYDSVYIHMNPAPSREVSGAMERAFQFLCASNLVDNDYPE